MSTATGTPTSLPALMNSLLSEPGRPRLTWYGQDGERIELSGAVLVNWINKTTNLLVEEFDAAPGCRVMIDLPTHWRAAIWAMATWRAGATVVIDSAVIDSAVVDGTPESTVRPTPDADVVVTTRPAAFTGTTADVVAVALPALARRYDGDLPPGAIDAAGAVMTYADQILWVQDADPAEPALVVTGPDGRTVAHGDLLTDALGAATAAGALSAATAAGSGPGTPAARVLLDGRRPPAAALTTLLGVWAAGGSAVLTSAEHAAALDADPSRRDRLVAQEGVTALG